MNQNRGTGYFDKHSKEQIVGMYINSQNRHSEEKLQWTQEKHELLTKQLELNEVIDALLPLAEKQFQNDMRHKEALTERYGGEVMRHNIIAVYSELMRRMELNRPNLTKQAIINHLAQKYGHYSPATLKRYICKYRRNLKNNE